MQRYVILGLVACLMGGAYVSALNYQQTSPSYSDQKTEDTRIRYAKACLQLADVDLELGLSLRREGVTTDSHIDRLRTNVGFAKEQLKIVSEETDATTKPVMAIYAESAAARALREYNTAREIDEDMPGNTSSLQLEQLRLKTEVARLRVELWNDPSNLSSLVDEMQWQMDRLTEQVLNLELRLEALE